MHRKGLIILFITVLYCTVSGQEISHKVLVPLASFKTIGGYCVSQTIGEPVVKYLPGETYDLTQGFQQPSVTVDRPEPPQGTGVKVYPNPVKNTLKLELFGAKSAEYHLTIFGLNGSIYLRNTYNCVGKYWHIIPLDLSKYRRGTYFVRVEDNTGAVRRLFKIEKM